ncbi:MAG TPA: YggT family protein [Ilumatobacter sp.]|jgi:uncharacterized protein YggT (Ycf19 family)|nr:YggT family protein [Ilumatobacter sp.]
MSPSTKTVVIKICRALVWIVYAWVAITIVLLFLAFLLQLFGADPSAGFVEFVYRSTERAMAPFRGIFESVVLSDDSVLDVSILFAIIVYSFVALGLGMALDWVTRKLLAAEDHERYDAMLEAKLSPARPASGYVVHLSGADGAAATGVLSAQAAGTFVDLTAVGLDATRKYAVWSENGAGQRLTAATFQPGVVGPTKLAMTSPIGLTDMRLFGVSLLGPSDEAVADVLAARIAVGHA